MFHPIWVSSNVEYVLGYSPEEALKSNWWWSNIHLADKADLVTDSEVLIQQKKHTHEYRFKHGNSGYIWVRDELNITEENNEIFITGCWTNINRDMTALDALHVKSSVLQNTNIGILILNNSRQIVEANPIVSDLFGCSENEMIGIDIKHVLNRLSNSINIDGIIDTVNRNENWEGSIKHTDEQGKTFYFLINVHKIPSVTSELNSYYSVFLNDITELIEKDDFINHLSTTDILTGIPNRYALNISIDRMINDQAYRQDKFLIMFIGINRFRLINESRGFTFGDEVIKQFSILIRASLPKDIELFRFGGVEFVALAPDNLNREEIYKLAAIIREATRKPIQIPGSGSASIRCNIGVSMYPYDATDAHELLSEANAAMAEAKSFHGRDIGFYDKKLTEKAKSALIIEHEISNAIEEKELRLLFQPVKDSQTSKIVGAEALLRWENKVLGHVSPSDFIPIAESSGLILDIGDWVIENAVKQISEWLNDGINPGVIAINVAAKQISPDLVRTIEETLSRYDVSPSHIELELTESGLMSSEHNINTVLNNLKDIGITLAIDDFGTGYSSLAYLKNYPLDKVKVDKSFILDIETSTGSRAMVNAIIKMAQALELKVQAEGVENVNQLQFLEELGCNCWQGYLYSKPLNPFDFQSLLKRSASDHLELIH